MVAVSLSESDPFAGSLAKIIEFGSPRFTAPHRPYVDNVGRMKGENSFHSFVGDRSANRKHLIDASSFSADNGAGKYLYPFFITFFDFTVHLHNITNFKMWYLFL